MYTSLSWFFSKLYKFNQWDFYYKTFFMKSYFLFWDQAINFNDCAHVGLSHMYGVVAIIFLGQDLCGWMVEKTRNSYPFINKN